MPTRQQLDIDQAYRTEPHNTVRITGTMCGLGLVIQPPICAVMGDPERVSGSGGLTGVIPDRC
jgi:hypothetical protein